MGGCVFSTRPCDAETGKHKQNTVRLSEHINEWVTLRGFLPPEKVLLHLFGHVLVVGKAVVEVEPDVGKLVASLAIKGNGMLLGDSLFYYRVLVNQVHWRLFARARRAGGLQRVDTPSQLERAGPAA